MRRTLILAVILMVPACAVAETDSQIELEAQIHALLAEIAALQLELRSLERSVVADRCPDMSRSLSVGARGNDVRSLQNFLIGEGVLNFGLDTGFFGSMTQAAVQTWQSQHLDLHDGTPETNGYGVVGPRTRDEIAKACGPGIVQSRIAPVEPNTVTTVPFDVTASSSDNHDSFREN